MGCLHKVTHDLRGFRTARFVAQWRCNTDRLVKDTVSVARHAKKNGQSRKGLAVFTKAQSCASA